MMNKKTPLESLKGMLRKPSKSVSIEQMKKVGLSNEKTDDLTLNEAAIFSDRDRIPTRDEANFGEAFDLSEHLIAFTQDRVDYEEKKHVAAAHKLVSQERALHSCEVRVTELSTIISWLREHRPDVWEQIQNFRNLDSFTRIKLKWDLTSEESNALYGIESEQSIRVATLSQIYKSLHMIHGNEIADKWVRMPNTNVNFGGQKPLNFMINGGIEAMKNVRDLLNSRAAGN